MTGKEIRKAAEVYVGKVIENDMALIAINEAMTVIGDMGLVYGTITVEATESEPYYLPTDYTNIRTIADENGDTYEDWKQLGDIMYFDDSGTYTIYARRIPPRITSLDEEPDIHRSYHNSIVRFLRLFVLQSSSDDVKDKRQQFESFEQDVMSVHRQLNRTRQPKQVKVIRYG